MNARTTHRAFPSGSHRAYFFSLTFLLLWVVIFDAGNAVAQETIQIDKQISKLLLDKKIQIPIPDFFGNKCYADGEIIGHPGGPLLCVPEFHDIHVASYSDITKSPMQDSPLPTSVTVTKYLRKNCTPVAQKIEEKITESKSETHTIVHDTTISVGTNSSVKGSISLSTKLFGGSLEASSGHTTNDTNSTNTTDSNSSSTSVEVPRTYDVPPWKILSVTVTNTRANSYYDVKGDVSIDADVFMRMHNRGMDNLSPQTHRVGMLSDLLPLEKDRAITLNERVWTVNTVETDEQDDMFDCPNAPTGASGAAAASAPTIAPASALVHLRSMVAQNNYGLADIKASQATQITVPIVDGMNVTTADVVGNVEVRAKSDGPGFCSVEVSSALGSSKILAPPMVWSDWTNLFSHLGTANASLGTSVECDTGAQFEVRYWR